MRSVSIVSYSPELVFTLMRGAEERPTLDDEPVGVTSLRLQTFLTKGVQCVACGIKGSHFRKERSHPSDPRPHLNLYARVPNGVEMLMTSDHIHPKSRGGSDSLENRQTMCLRCNSQKADRVP